MGFDPRWAERMGLDPIAPAADSPEADFQTAVIGFARGQGWAVAHFRRVRVQRKNTGEVYYETPVAADGKGFLDLVLARERLVWAELKVGKNKPTKDQEKWIHRLRAAGQEVYVWRPRDWPEILRILGRSGGRSAGTSSSMPSPIGVG